MFRVFQYILHISICHTKSFLFINKIRDAYLQYLEGLSTSYIWCCTCINNSRCFVKIVKSKFNSFNWVFKIGRRLSELKRTQRNIFNTFLWFVLSTSTNGLLLWLHESDVTETTGVSSNCSKTIVVSLNSFIILFVFHSNFYPASRCSFLSSF